MKILALLVAAVVLATTSCSTMKSKPAAPAVTTKSLKWKPAHDNELKYLLYLPADYDAKSGKRWPLMLFLHGAGERGTNVQRVAIHGPISLVKRGTNFPFIILAPLCPEGRYWQNEPLLGLLDHATKKFAVDTKRVYLTGISMGGYGTWNLAIDHPERFAAIAPICGGGELISLVLAQHYEPGRLAALRQVGIWAFHGGKDNVVPPDESERMVAALKKLGMKDVKLTVYPNAEHNSWTETYNHPELYAWLLQHKR